MTKHIEPVAWMNEHGAVTSFEHGRKAWESSGITSTALVRLSDAQAALAEAEERGRPQCEAIETAPKDGTRILLHPAVEVHDQWSKGHWSEDMRCWIVGGSPSGVEHTHWMTLPTPPAVAKEPTP